MLYAKDLAGEMVRPGKTGDRAECPICDTIVDAHCGTRVIHYWAHESLAECDPWAEHFSTAEGREWHLGWQESVDLKYGRVEVTITRDGIKHRADIVAENNTVIEIQHSGITAADITARELFYGDMVWIWDACRAYQEGRLQIWTAYGRDSRENWRNFSWPRGRVSVMDCKKPVFLDLGDDRLFQIARFTDTLQGEGKLIDKKTMIEWITHGPPLDLPTRPVYKRRVPKSQPQPEPQPEISPSYPLPVQPLSRKEEQIQRDRIRSLYPVPTIAGPILVGPILTKPTRLAAIQRASLPCGHWTAGDVCGALPARPYMIGSRCDTHSPWALAGRPHPDELVKIRPRT